MSGDRYNHKRLYRRLQSVLRSAPQNALQVAQRAQALRVAASREPRRRNQILHGVGDRAARRPGSGGKAATVLPCPSHSAGGFHPSGPFRDPQGMMPLAPVPGRPQQYARVIKTEEKGSDVNLATHLLHDAHRGRFEVAVIVSNDSDLLEPIKIVREGLGKKVGVLNPHKRPSRALLPISTSSRRSRGRASGLAVPRSNERPGWDFSQVDKVVRPDRRIVKRETAAALTHSSPPRRSRSSLALPGQRRKRRWNYEFESAFLRQ